MCTLNLILGSAERFEGDFRAADVYQPILGMDFNRLHEFVIDPNSHALSHVETYMCFLQQVSLLYLLYSAYARKSQYQAFLQEFSIICQPLQPRQT